MDADGWGVDMIGSNQALKSKYLPIKTCRSMPMQHTGLFSPPRNENSIVPLPACVVFKGFKMSSLEGKYVKQ